MQKVISGLVILVAVLGILTAVGAQLQLSAPPDAVTVTDTSDS